MYVPNFQHVGQVEGYLGQFQRSYDKVQGHQVKMSMLTAEVAEL